jgi:hypothetical protein
MCAREVLSDRRRPELKSTLGKFWLIFNQVSTLSPQITGGAVNHGEMSKRVDHARVRHFDRSARAWNHVDVADTLLAHAADKGMDFIVMGGHGQSRMREFFFGNVTDAVLHSVKVPALMSH